MKPLSHLPPRLPSPLPLLRHIPRGVHQAVLARLFSHLMQGQDILDQCREIEGKRLRLAVNDAGIHLQFHIHGGGLRSSPDEMPWDVRISGDLADFWRLAMRREDPDTLFFQRRLALEGETETALRIKNMLDALEFDWRAHLIAVVGQPGAAPLIRLLEQSGLEQHLIGRFPLLR